jgi:hypothetical protein
MSVIQCYSQMRGYLANTIIIVPNITKLQIQTKANTWLPSNT